MSSKPKTPAQPSDPDPSPISSGDPAPEIQGAARAERKRVARNYGRQQTILAGNTDDKKNILG